MIVVNLRTGHSTFHVLADMVSWRVRVAMRVRSWLAVKPANDEATAPRPAA